MAFIWFILIFASACLPCRAQAATGLTIGWTNNMLAIKAPGLPGDRVEILYLEAFCRSGSTHRDWHQTTIPHKTELLSADKNGKRLKLRTIVEGDIEVLHDIRAGKDD